MKRLVLLLLFFAGLAAANPFVVTYVSEFSTDTTGGQWLELHALPDQPGPYDLSGWQVITSTSACTLRCTLDYYQPCIVIDSASLAQGMNGTGAFRLNQNSDSIRLIDTTGWIWQVVSYPCDSTSVDRSLRPPQGGSASMWNVDCALGQALNWYLDSTPTPGEANNDYSTISGTVMLDSMPAGADVFVCPYGLHGGECESYGHMNPSFSIQGLGAGWYRVEAIVCSPRGLLRGFYPDSIYVGFGQTRTGVGIDLRTVSVAEPARPAPSAMPELRVHGAELDVLCPTPADVRLAVYDLTGALRAVLRQGRLESGQHRFELSSRVPAGVYFARLASGDRTAAAKVIVPR
jgi:hypothetical protein